MRLLIVLFMLLPYGVYSQQCFDPRDYTSTYVPAVVLLGTFYAVNMGDTQTHRDRIAFTGMATAAATYFVIEGVKARKAKKRRVNNSDWVSTNN